MEVSIPPYLQEFIDEQVRNGRYKTATDVIQSALAHLATISDSSAEEAAELKRELAEGLEQADRGEFVSFTADEIIREGRDLMARRQKAI